MSGAFLFCPGLHGGKAAQGKAWQAFVLCLSGYDELGLGGVRMQGLLLSLSEQVAGLGLGLHTALSEAGAPMALN